MKTALALLLGLPLAAAAQSVSMAGQMGARALLVIDGRPQTLAVGQSAQGVRLQSLQAGEAVVEVGGQRLLLRTGATPATLAVAAAPPAGREIVIAAGSGGHFVAAGSINGRTVQFMVDTGATLVALGQRDARRIGLDFQSGRRVTMQTANGSAPGHLVTLRTVRLGDVELLNVEAVVVPASMPMVLLGNSFLSRLQMRRDNDVMRLELR